MVPGREAARENVSTTSRFAYYVRAAQSGSYGLELIAAACDEPSAQRECSRAGKAFSDDVDEENIAASVRARIEHRCRSKSRQVITKVRGGLRRESDHCSARALSSKRIVTGTASG